MNEDAAKLLGILLLPIIKRQAPQAQPEWLEEKGKLIRENKTNTALTAAFAAVPRKFGKLPFEIFENELAEIDALFHQFSVKNWSIDKVCRLWLLLQIDSTDKKSYHHLIESLFRDAEMNELAALYASLPVFAYPESWQFQTTEGIRSNIGSVLDAIMYDNPYPGKYLQEPSWNQLVLKAFFNDKDVHRIIGLDDRSNKALASILIDYAHERQAAHRAVNPQLWRLVSKFIDEDNIIDIEKLLEDGHITERRAAVLACFHSDYPPAKRLLEKEPVMYAAVKTNQLNWNLL